MFCSNCGKELPDNVAFCFNCGTRLNTYQPNGGHAPWTQQYNPMPHAQPLQPEMPMKWYKFLINFSLFAGAVLNLIGGIVCFAGNGFFLSGEVDSATLYNTYEGLRTLDIGYGIVYIALIPFALYLRFALSGFKKDAPTMLYIYSAACEIISITYLIFSSVIMDGSFSQIVGEIIVDVSGKILYIALNIIYFNKRKHLFVN